MQPESNSEAKPQPQLMEAELSDHHQDLFQQQLMVDQVMNRSMESERSNKFMWQSAHHRSTYDLNRPSDFRKILNSSSSNERLIPSSIKHHDSSRQNSDVEPFRIETENSNNSSFRKSFKKKFDESFSISHTVRDSSSSFSERSESQNSHNIIIPQVYKEEASVGQQIRTGCNCKKSRCLKLYCQCFQRRMLCMPQCHCRNCGNHAANQQEHRQAVIEALARNAHAFEQGQSQPQNKKPSQKGFAIQYQPQDVRKGCKCKRTRCLKKYCQCFNSGIPCTVFCRCEGCQNKDSKAPDAQPTIHPILSKKIQQL